MKKTIKLLFLLFVILININVYAKSDVYIESVDLIDDSIIGDVEILEDSSFEDMSLKFNIRFYEINSSVKYKVVVKNNSDKNYTMSDNIIDNNDMGYDKQIYNTIKVGEKYRVTMRDSPNDTSVNIHILQVHNDTG